MIYVKNILKPKTILLMFVFVVVGVLLCLFAFGVFKNTNGWIETTGTIIKKTNSDTLVRFVYAGETHEAYLGMGSDTFVIGNTIAIKVNPNNLNEITSNDSTLKTIMLALGGTFSILGLGSFFIFLTKGICENKQKNGTEVASIGE